MELADIEKQVFAKLLSSAKVLSKNINKISPDDFTGPTLRMVIKAFSEKPEAVAHYVPSKNFFEILLRDYVRSKDKLDNLVTALHNMASKDRDVDDIDVLIKELKANRMCREVTSLIQKHVPMISPESIEETYDSMVKELLQLPVKSSGNVSMVRIGEVNDTIEDRVLDYLKPSTRRIPTTIKAFDAAAGGFSPGEFAIITAGQGHGKSMMLLWLAERMVENNMSGIYVTIEMSYEATLERYHSIQTGFDSILIKNKQIPDSEKPKYFEKLIAASKDKSVRDAFLKECETIGNRNDPRAALELSKKYKNRQGKLFIIDMPDRCTPARIEQEIHRIMMDNKIDFVAVDFINCMQPNSVIRDGSQALSLSTISRDLKIVARKTDLLVISAAQLDTTKMEGTQDEVITTDHIKYSKAIGENADWVIGFYRTQEDNINKQVRLQFVKHRHSAAVTALVGMDFSTMQAMDLGFAPGSNIPTGYDATGERAKSWDESIDRARRALSPEYPVEQLEFQNGDIYSEDMDSPGYI